MEKDKMENDTMEKEDLLEERARNIKILNESELSRNINNLDKRIQNFRKGYGEYNNFGFFDRHVDKEEDCRSLLFLSREQLKKKGYNLDLETSYEYGGFSGRCRIYLDLCNGIFDRVSKSVN